MKALLTAWLMYNGVLVPESIVQKEFPSMAACQSKGKEIVKLFNGRNTIHTGHYICTEQGLDV